MMLDMSWVEIAGFGTGAVSVWLYVRQNVWAWPVGIANSVCWLVLFWVSRLFLDAGLQILYIGLGFAGWYWWLHGGDRPGELPVARTARRAAIALAGVGLVGTLGLWWAMAAVSDAMPLPDAATTVVSLIAQYLLTRKLLASWWCWITVDLAYIVMYTAQHLYLTAALQPLFITMCLAGWRRWRAELRDSTGRAAPAAVVR